MKGCSINNIHKDQFISNELTIQKEPKAHLDKKTCFLLNGIVISSVFDWLLRSHPINKQAKAMIRTVNQNYYLLLKKRHKNNNTVSPFLVIRNTHQVVAEHFYSSQKVTSKAN